MIQRIQTLYLVALIVLQALSTQFTLFTFHQLPESFDLNFMGLYAKNGVQIVSEIKLLLMAIIASITAIIAILYFKKRPLQVKLVKIILLLLTAQVALSAKFFIAFYNKYGKDFSVGLALIFLAGSFIVSFLAIRAINKDENLIKSVDRIR